MLQEGVPRRFLVARGSEGLELLLLPRAPTPCPLSIYCIPLPQATSSLLPPGDQKALLVLVSPVMQNRIGSAVGWTHCRVWSVGKPGSTPWGLLAVKQLHFFYWKEKKKKKGNETTLALLSDIESRQFSLLLPPDPCLPPSALLSRRRDWCFFVVRVGTLEVCLWRRGTGRCTG